MIAKQIGVLPLQLVIAVPMFFATYWSWMILAMISGSLLPSETLAFYLSLTLAFLLNAVFATVLVAAVGAVFNLRGRFTITLVGACIGSVIAGVLFIPFLYHVLVFLIGALPTLGAILAYHWSAYRALTPQ